MFIRQLYYLVAIEKTGHFRRAAELANVSQPALSSAIQHLEEELGIKIIQRGQRFQGFTPEGVHLLGWAHKIIHEWEGMHQEAALYSHGLKGTLRIGAIPTSLAIIPLITEPYQSRFPDVSVKISSLSTEALIDQLDNFELDLGITYLEDPSLKGFNILPLYREHHVLLSRQPDLPISEGGMSWGEAAQLPLCLLTQNMQNRRLIDAAFREAGVTPNVKLETDSVLALYTHVRCAGLFSIVPHSLLSLFELRQEVTAIPLVPELNRSIGLIARAEKPSPPIRERAWEIAASLDLQSRLDALIDMI